MAPLQDTIEEYGELQQSSPIQQFYQNKSIFITGATGFLGKVLIEKLLRACDVERIFILIRSKKNDDVNTRMEKIFEDQLFDQVRRKDPDYRRKIHPINGDCILPGLGISSPDRALLIKHCNVVFHGAATVRFDEKLKLALSINVCGTREILTLAKEMEQLNAFLHISTAYANCPLKEIEEKFYPTPISGESGTHLAEILDDETLEKITPTLLRDWPNTYTYTKSLAEDYVRAHSKGMPVAVFRPAIVIPTYREPLRGWIDNMYGPTGIVIGVAAGLLRVLHINKENRAELVPVDMSVNSLIASAYDIGVNSHYDEPPIYNYVTSKKNSISWQDYCEYSTLNGVSAPLSKMAWYFTFTMTSSKALAVILTFLYHTVPATIVDGVLVLFGKKPKLLDTYRKIHKLCHVLSYFTNRVWSFKNHNVENLWRKLDIKDKELFYFDMADMDWPSFFVDSIFGIRTYLMKEDPKTIPDAVKRLKRMKLIHYITVYTIRFGALYLLYKILKSMLF